jgi:hypothetical protein
MHGVQRVVCYMGVPTRGHRGCGERSGTGGIGSLLGEVQLGVRNEHPGVKATRRATRGSGRLTVTVARHEDGGGGSARRQCSEERRAAPTCPTSR